MKEVHSTTLAGEGDKTDPAVQRCSRCGRYEDGSRQCPNGDSVCPVNAVAGAQPSQPTSKPINGFKEWAAVNYPLGPGWNTATDLLLRRAWMDARNSGAGVASLYKARAE